MSLLTSKQNGFTICQKNAYLVTYIYTYFSSHGAR